MEDLLQGRAPDDGELTQVQESVHHPVVELVRVSGEVRLHPAERNYDNDARNDRKPQRKIILIAGGIKYLR